MEKNMFMRISILGVLMLLARTNITPAISGISDEKINTGLDKDRTGKQLIDDIITDDGNMGEKGDMYEHI